MTGISFSRSRHRYLCVVLCLLAAGLFSPAPADAFREPPSLWQTLTPGIDYREYFLPGPNHVYVARLDRQADGVTIDTGLAQGISGGGLETVRDQAARYDQALNDWGGQWGGRNRVVAAINGSYFNPDTGAVWSGLVQSGGYVRRFADKQNSSGFTWTFDRTAFIGSCVMHRPGKQLITVQDKGTIAFDGINILPEDDDLILYTSHYGRVTPLLDKGIEIVVELTTPLLILPEPQAVQGVVEEILENQGGGTPLPFDVLVLVAQGEAYREMKGKLQVGDRIGISQELRHLTQDCSRPRTESFTQAYAAIAGSYIFLEQGQVQPLDELGAVLRNPRTAVVLNERFVYFIVVDGRDRLRSTGMSMVELATFARMALGATWGIAQDGGGSSTMVVNGTLRNRPNAAAGEAAGPAATTAPGMPETAAGVVKSPPSETALQERAVANSLLMIAVEPAAFSDHFGAGAAVTLTEPGPVNLRLGPGTNYAVLTALPVGSTGVVLAHALNGVQAKGYFWWKVRFGEETGWVNENSLR